MKGPEVTRLPAGPDSVGDARARDFGSYFNSSFRVLWLIAAGTVGDADLADDIVQEAAMIAYAKFDQFAPGTSFAAWAGKIVKNVALNRGRSERRRRVSTSISAPLDVSALPAQASSGPMNPQPAEIDSRILTALQGISETARACLLLRTLEGMEYSQIAAILGLPEGTAMSHVHRARSYLRERLADLWKDRDFGRQTNSG